MLKCDRRTIHHMIKSGRLNAINLSVRKTRVLKNDIDLMLIDPVHETDIQKEAQVVEKRPPIKECYTVGQILAKYSVAEVT